MLAKNIDKVIFEYLVQNGALTLPDAEKLLTQAQNSGEAFHAYLLRNDRASENQILSALSVGLGLATIDLKNTVIDAEVIKKVPVKFAWYYKFMPVKLENKVLIMAVSAPLDIKIQDEIRVHLGVEPRLVLARESDLLDALKKYYGLASDTIDRILTRDPGKKAAAAGPDSGQWIEDLEKKTDDVSVARLVNQIILEAYQKRATDIHIEPYREKVRIRYRIDGVLVDANLPSEVKHFLLPILSRIKIMANLSIVEKRLPQDGSMIVKTKDQDLDLRVSTLPTPRGESIVIRILPTKVMLFKLEKLGLDHENLKKFQSMIEKPHGIVFITGPTGSGKTTTLYACLNAINSSERKIITIEDPVEYEMEGVTQIQVNPKVNLTFAAGLRSVLRHDPDIIMVGEVRDLETAEIAIRTALTGHLVFSTLHTNDASSGVTRLIEMGVEPYLVASSVEAFIAQRLLRVICPKCKEEVKEPLTEIKKEIGAALKIEAGQIKIYQGRGCDHCNQTGFYGRTAVYEVLVMTDELRAAILEKPRAEHLKQIAIRRGMGTLRQDGWRKVIEGLTTPAEVLNTTAKDELLSAGAMPGEENNDDLSSDQLQIVSKEIVSARKDARVFRRILEEIQVRYKINQKEFVQQAVMLAPDVEYATITKDISASGLRFVCSHAIPIGTILELKIQLESGSRSIDCLAKVCRNEENNLSNQFHVAVYYLDISSADRAKLNNFVLGKMDKSI